MQAYFCASVFLRLCRDDQGAVALLPLFNYILRRNAMLQAVGPLFLRGSTHLQWHEREHFCHRSAGQATNHRQGKASTSSTCRQLNALAVCIIHLCTSPT